MAMNLFTISRLMSLWVMSCKNYKPGNNKVLKFYT